MPDSEPNRNFLPSFFAPRTNSGTFKSMVITPIWPKPRSSRRIIARPLMPPTFRLFGSRNRSKPSAKMALPRVIFHPICQMVLSVSRFKPSSSRTSFLSDIQLHLCFADVLSAQERACGGQRPGRIAAYVAERCFFQLRGRFDGGLSLQAHHSDALRRARGLGGKLRRGEHEHAPVRCADDDLLFLRQIDHGPERALVGVCARQPLAVGFGVIAARSDLRRLAVFKDEEQIALVFSGENDRQEALALIEAELTGQEIAERGGLAVGKIGNVRLVDLIFVGEDEHLARCSAPGRSEAGCRPP